jgi:dihydrodipicolinate synthase/N-acetylneuraminate lyase
MGCMSTSTSASKKKHCGVIVPMVTPLTPRGKLDQPAIERLVEFFRKGGVHGVFVLGTTGEGPSVPSLMREPLVRIVADCARGRLLVYAGISNDSARDSAVAGNRYFRRGVDAVVAHAPASYERHPEESAQYFAEVARQLDGELMLYNMPLTTNVSLPVDVCGEIARKPRVIGIKDSENDAERLGALLKRVGGEESFSVFVGTGALMASGLLRGARGIVPSVGNLDPGLCRRLYDCAVHGDSQGTQSLHRRFMELAQVYQKGRTLEQSLAALKGAMACLGLCGPDVFLPLKPVNAAERAALAAELARLGLPVRDAHTDESRASVRADNGRRTARR